MRIEAQPESIFSWNFSLRERSRSIGSVRFYRMRDSGSVLFEGSEFEVDKQGMFSGSWNLLHGSTLAATAHKGMFRSGVEIDCDGEVFELARTSSFSSEYELRRGGRRVGTVRRSGWLSRAFEAELDEDLPRSVRAFAVWLYAVLRRRRSRRSN